MNRQRLLLIINPVSGTKSKRGLAERIERRVRLMGYEMDTAVTTCRGDATRLAKEAVDKGYYGVLACGGDGTVNETARALCRSDVALGIIPAGSGNGLARHIGIPVDPVRSLDVIAENNIVECDYGTVDGKPFFCTFGVGFDAAVSMRFASQSRRGLMTYIRSVFTEFRSYKARNYTLKIDGDTLTEEAFLIACCNSSQYGNNACIAPDASITDGLLDIIVIGKASKPRMALVGWRLMTGNIGRDSLVRVFKARQATIIRGQEDVAHIDGEPVVMPAQIDIRCHQGKLKIFAASSKRRGVSDPGHML